MKVKVIGGGLAGCESAYQLLKRGINVDMYEMRGVKSTPCHKTDGLAELVCSNSLKAQSLDNASGLLKYELARLDSLILKCAYKTDVPAGGALAVDREKFSALVREELDKFDGFRLIREEVCDIDEDSPTVIATGPLTADALSRDIEKKFGGALHFYDATAPVVAADSVDYEKTFSQSRYGKGDGDYVNCPLTKAEYETFVSELLKAERAELHEFEKREIFEGCMPVEVMAARGKDTLRYGMLKPVGLETEGVRPYAVLQLRRENAAGTSLGLVGFQTNLKFGEHKMVF